MKRYLIICINLICLGLTSKAQIQYTIKGELKQYPDSNVLAHLFYSAADGRFVNESCPVTSGTFSFEGSVAQNQQAFVSFTTNNQSLNSALQSNVGKSKIPKLTQIVVFLDSGNINLSVDYEKQSQAIVSGTKANNAYQEFKAVVDKYRNQELLLTKKSGSNTSSQNNMMKEYNALMDNRGAELGDLIQKFNNIFPSLFILDRWIDPGSHFSLASKYFNLLSDDLKKTNLARRYYRRIQEADKFTAGKFAPDITLPDAFAKPVSLQKFRGKYVLLDFWASWCLPCRKETPNLIAAYSKYKSKGFEILSISLDGGKKGSRQAWLDAIKKDKMSWTQLIDEAAFDGVSRKIYGVQSLPTNYLIDPEGKIIAKNLRGYELQNLLLTLNALK